MFAVLLLAGSAYAIAQTLVAPAIPEITRRYEASPAAVSWLLTGFLLAAAIATPIAGKLGDVHGRGKVLAAVMLIYAAGSVICALSPTIGPMIGGRVLQGVSGGVYPLAYAVIKETFPAEKVAFGLSMVSVLVGLGAAAGLAMAGPIVEHLGVSWLFWTGLVGLPTALGALWLIPSRPAAAGTTIDWRGAALLSAALSCVLLAITRANEWGWDSPPTVGLFVAGVAIAALWLRLERHTRQPLIELRLLRTRTMLAVNLGSLLFGFVTFTGFLLIPQLAHADEATGYGLGFTVAGAGLVVLPLAFCQFAAGPLAARVGGRIGFRSTLIIGAATCSSSLLLLALAHDRLAGLLVGGGLIGAGVAFAFAGAANLVVDAVPAGDVGIATGINTVARAVGSAFGTAVATAILTSDLQPSTGLPTSSAYTIAFAVAAATGLLSLLCSLAIPRGLGAR
ncbi:MAG: MFS transporter [Solirubrobacterales bacterium]